MDYLDNQPRAVLGQILADQVLVAERAAERTAVDANEQKFDMESTRIQAYVSAQLARRDGIVQEAQKELAHAIRLIGDIATTDRTWIRKNLQLLGSIDTAVRAILRDEPQIEYARRTLTGVHRKVHPFIWAGIWESLKRSMKTSPAAVVVAGLAIAFLLLIFLPLLRRGLDLSPLTIGSLLNVDPSVLLLIAVVGALGSIASIMLRIRGSDFETYKSTASDPWPWLFFGLFKPVIGALFALFTFAAIKAGLLPVEVAEATEGWFIVTIAFIAGFSERLAPSILSSTEGRIVTVPQPSPTPPPSADDANDRGDAKPPAPAANAAEVG